LAAWQELRADRSIWEKVVFNQTKKLKKHPLLDDYILEAMMEVWEKAKLGDLARNINPLTAKHYDLVNTVGRIVSNHMIDKVRYLNRHAPMNEITEVDEGEERKNIFDTMEGYGDVESDMEFKEILEALHQYVAKHDDPKGTNKTLFDIWIKSVENNVDMNTGGYIKFLAKKFEMSESNVYLAIRHLKNDIIVPFFEKELGYKLTSKQKATFKLSSVGLVAMEYRLAYEEWRRRVARFVLGGLHEQVGTVFDKPDDVVARIREEKKNAGKKTASALDGMPNMKARRIVNNILIRATPKGIVRDSDWSHINLIWKALKEEHIEYTLSSADYRHDEQGRPSAKEWKFTIEFTNNNGKPTTLFGNITAHGAGNLEDLMERYDVTALVG
jgi:hypothetical protein